MKYKAKRLREAVKNLNLKRSYSPKEALELLKGVPAVKFDQSMEVSLNMNVDPKKADQQVRGTVTLPHGTGKKSRVLVLAKGEKADAAKAAGADYVGAEELADKIAEGWTDFDAVVTTPDMMRVVGRLGKVLGPRGLMPTPKAGTVTQDVETAVKDIKSGKIEFKVDKGGNLNAQFGKMSFSTDQLVSNYKALMDAIMKCRPSTVKGAYIKSISMSSTMGPGVKIEYQAVQAG